jgi:hypothetical protein
VGDVAIAGRWRARELGHLQGLADPEFFRQWAAARSRLALTSSSSPKYSEIKDEYDALAAEYRRRLDGAPQSL